MEIEGFRCLRNIKLEFDDKLTLIVGENDAGKSSVIDCIKVVTQGRPVESTDFSSGESDMKLVVICDDCEYQKSFRLEGDTVSEQPLLARPREEYVTKIRSWIESENTDFEDEKELEKLRGIARTFGIVVRSNSRSDTLTNNLLSKIEKNQDDSRCVIENAGFPEFSSIQLDGRQFEDISAFFRETFLKEFQSSLWQQRVNGEETIEDIVQNAIDMYSKEIGSQLEKSGIKDKIKVFLPTLTDIKIVPDYSQRL